MNGVIDLKAMVPAKDYALSKQFYIDLGFTQNWESDELSEFAVGSCRFLLQNFYVEQLAANFVLHLTVDDVNSWWQEICTRKLTEKYAGIMAKEPQDMPWGQRVVFLTDPSGVLWQISQLLEE